MFIRIGELRIKLSSIGEYKRGCQGIASKRWYITLKVSGKERILDFASERELDRVCTYLDRVLKVVEV